MDFVPVPDRVRAAKIEQLMALYEDSLLRMCFVYLHDAALAEAVLKADAFTLQIQFFMDGLYSWNDGANIYRKTTASYNFTVSFDIVKNGAAKVHQSSGQLDYEGTSVEVTAVMTPVFISLRSPKADGLEFAVFDPATGEEARCLSVLPQADGTILQTFAGFGRMMETISACPIVFPSPAPGDAQTQDVVYLTDQAVVMGP